MSGLPKFKMYVGTIFRKTNCQIDVLCLQNKAE
jgi:hypothetical protein